MIIGLILEKCDKSNKYDDSINKCSDLINKKIDGEEIPYYELPQQTKK